MEPRLIRLCMWMHMDALLHTCLCVNLMMEDVQSALTTRYTCAWMRSTLVYLE